MNIIMTRPLIEIENFMSNLLSRGHNIVHLPTLKIKPISTASFDLENFDAVIFTSANAIRSLRDIKNVKKIKCFCVGSITERIARSSGFINTISASGSVIALKNIILNSKELNDGARLAYVCGDNITQDIEKDLTMEGFKVTQIVNYSSEKIEEVSDQTLKLIKKYPVNVIFVYSLRSAEALLTIIKNYSLAPIMTQSKVMCISKNIADFFEKNGWKNVATFRPGEEMLNLEIVK